MPTYLTREGLKRLKEELKELKTKQRQEIADRLQQSVSFGDLSENAEYQEAKSDQAMLEGKIMELEELVDSAVIIDDTVGDKNVVSVGSTVTVKEVGGGGQEQRLTIVGSEEADPIKGIISNESPLGSAFLGVKAGAEVEVQTPSGKKRFKIVKVERDRD